MGSGLSKHPDEIKANQRAPLSASSQFPSPSADDSQTTIPSQQPQEGGGCPMKRSDGSYTFDWKALLRPEFPHRQGAPTTKETTASSNSQSSATSIQDQSQSLASSQGGCPVKQQQQQHPQYNVYSQPIDPSNNMPQVANQLPAPNQRKPLSTERVSSSIPKV
jgi:hypothetical protein